MKIINCICISILFSGLIFFSACNPRINDKDINKKCRLDFNIENKVDSILKLLTLEEKISLLHANSLFSSSGVEGLNIPELRYTDGPHGIRDEMERHSWASLNLTNDSATYFPTGTALAATWNINLALAYGDALGAEARARGKDILLGPAVNIIRTPVNGRNYEYFSEDPFLNSQMAVNYIKGVQSNDVGACIKHYALNNQEMFRGRIDVNIDERALREIYLPVYKAAVQEANVYAIMGAYNKFRGNYCCENKYLLKDILKYEWGFKGIVISDWHATHSTIDAALNGLDIEMGTNKGEYDNFYFAQPLLDLVRSGNIDEKIIDEKARRILRVMLNCKTMDENRLKGSFATVEHSKVAYNVASESIVLLKNQNKLLPLDIEKINSIAVIGDNAIEKHASGGFGADVKAKYEISPLEGLEKMVGERADIRFAQGYKKISPAFTRNGWKFVRLDDNNIDTFLINEAVNVASNSDVAIIFAGLNHYYDTEAVDKDNMKLPYGQDILIKHVIKANPNTIVVIISGSPVDLSQITNCSSTILWAWLNGAEAGNAIADVLFGIVNPSGKLPFTIPYSLDDSPAHFLKTYPGEDFIANYSEGILVGYRWFDIKNINPLYCFGYGLSYSEFIYSGIKTNKNTYRKDEIIEISFKLKNSGKYSGSEVVQLYISDINSKVLKPLKELKGFKKVFLKPGESKKVTLTCEVKDLAYFDDKLMDWVINEGDYKLLIGSSSRDIRLSKLIRIKSVRL
ncbi:MAG: glycoside hydrolase family 3 C-terminal domain-containing protein [Bacteroidales bacterium]|nr:glycoside hydrolase family 3 C-terminal domain-containing protein [Bacteroidales bacterium]